MNKIPQGVTESERIGRKCTLRSIAWRFNISLAEQDAIATPAAGDVVRVLLYLDKQANGATSVITDIWEVADWQTFNNLANSGRFKTIMDRTYTINYKTLASDNAAVVSSANCTVEDSFYKKINIPLEFSASTGAITEIRSNNLGVLLISKEGNTSFESKFRLRFSDGG